MNRRRKAASKQPMRVATKSGVLPVYWPLFWLFAIALVFLRAAQTQANGPAQDDPELRAATAVASEETCGTAAARRVQSHYESVRDLSARFEQTTHSVALGTGAAAASTRTAGEVVFAKPGRMRWHYKSPAESLVVTDGELLWIVDMAAKEAQRLPVSQDYLSGAALQFLIGEGDLVAEFRVTSPDCDADPQTLELVPRQEASYERLLLRVDRATGAVQETEIFDLFGNVTRVRFEEMRTNTAPGDERFTYEPPPEMRVTDLVVP